MGWFSEDSSQAQAWNTYNNTPREQHQAKFSHELIGGAAAYEAMKAYEERQGRPDDHAKAKEVAVGLAGAFIDREVESKGMNWVDKEEAKRHARQHIDDVDARGQW